MDALHIRRIRAYGYTGALPEEQVLGQWFEVDVTLYLDLTLSGESDRLEDTCDYRDLVAQTQHLIRTTTFMLIEALTEAIAQSILEHAAVSQVRVQLTKLSPPIPDFDGHITVDITRSKSRLN